MKIYFTSTPRGREDYLENYKKIHKLVIDLGHCHVHDFLFQDDSYLKSNNDSLFKKQYEKTIKDLKQCDVALFEISTPSLGIGYLINKSLEIGKPTIALHVSGKRPLLLDIINSDKLQIIEYNSTSLEFDLRDALETAKENLDTRFNFFVSPLILSYLEWISKTKKIPRAVYLRNLIEKDMKKEGKIIEDL